MFFLATFALAGPYKDMATDVIVSTTIEAPLEVIHERVRRLDFFKEYLPSSCVARFTLTEAVSGVGARGEVIYTIGPMRRKLRFEVIKDEPGKVWTLDHKGNRGFATQVQYERATSKVTIGTYLAPPPWPFRKVYQKKVKPAWEQCYEEYLQALKAAVMAEQAP